MIADAGNFLQFTSEITADEIQICLIFTSLLGNFQNHSKINIKKKIMVPPEICCYKPSNYIHIFF